MSDEAEEARRRLNLWLRYGNPRPNPISDEGKQFENDLQLVTELVASSPPSGADAALVAEARDMVERADLQRTDRNAMITRLVARLQAAPPADPDPYVPTVLHNEAAGFYEFVSEDVLGVWCFIAPNIEQMVSMKDRERVVGMRAHALPNPTASLPAEALDLAGASPPRSDPNG